MRKAKGRKGFDTNARCVDKIVSVKKLMAELIANPN